MIAPYPHHYTVVCSGGPEADLNLTSHGLPPLGVAPPEEFGGPGDQWSPENLVAGAVASCFALTFRAVAAASKLEWTSLSCSAKGVLDRKDGIARFTEFHLEVELISSDEEARAGRLIEKAEKNCLITNSLNVETALNFTVVTK